MDFLQQKEELQNKRNEINLFRKDLGTTYQKELKTRHDEYQEDKTMKKAKGNLFDTTKKLLLS